MKNVRENQLKKAIFFELDEFDEVMKTVFGKEAGCEHEDFDLTLRTDKDENGDDWSLEEIFAKLAEYFEVKQITSIHNDNYDVVGVWVIYKD